MIGGQQQGMVPGSSNPTSSTMTMGGGTMTIAAPGMRICSSLVIGTPFLRFRAAFYLSPS